MTRKKKKQLVVIGIGVAVLLAVFIAWRMLGGSTDTPSAVQQVPARSQLTGLTVSAEEAALPILGIMIENSEAARPQRGLDSAGIVFEAVTEGGITRFLALYQEDTPDILGPVRSLRTHFLDWGMGFDATIAHVGGSPGALDAAEERDAKTLNEFTYDEPYYRDNDRPAPHNMFVRTQGLRELQNELNHKTSSFPGIPRSDEAATSTSTPAQSINIDFSQPAFAVEFRYDTTTRKYTRYLAGQPHTDTATNAPITVENIIVLRTETDDDNNIRAIGSGAALVFKNGTVVEGTWTQPGSDERFIVSDANGKEIPLKRGQTWVAALPSDRPVNYQ